MPSAFVTTGNGEVHFAFIISHFSSNIGNRETWLDFGIVEDDKCQMKDAEILNDWGVQL